MILSKCVVRIWRMNRQNFRNKDLILDFLFFRLFNPSQPPNKATWPPGSKISWKASNEIYLPKTETSKI